MARRILFFLILVLIAFIINGNLHAQQAIKKITKIEGSKLYFGNNDSITLPALKDTSYQLVIMLFHAEQDTIGLDPGLSTDGRWRAINLMKLLKPVDFKAFYTTPFRNNILSLQPLVDNRQAKYSYYDQADLVTLTESIKRNAPSPVIIAVHPETVGNIFEQLSKQKLQLSKTSNNSERIIFLQRSKTKPSIWSEYKYAIR